MARHKLKSKSTASRNTRLADQIQKDLAHVIQRELSASQVGLITLTHVELSADYAHAKVYFSVIGAEPVNVESILNDKAGYLHSVLFKLLHIHTVPSLTFIHDDHLVQGIKMNRLIDQANAPGSQADDDQDDDDDSDQNLEDIKIKG